MLIKLMENKIIKMNQIQITKKEKFLTLEEINICTEFKKDEEEE